MGYAEMARLDLQTNSLARSYLDRIFKGSERARDLVKHMFAFVRRSEPGLRPMKVGPVVKEVLELLRASFPSTVDIRQDIEACHDTILGDPSQIQQVLMNPGTNVNHAMRESGGVRRGDARSRGSAS
jgi:signal transduction histidine kinase